MDKLKIIQTIKDWAESNGIKLKELGQEEYNRQVRNKAPEIFKHLLDEKLVEEKQFDDFLAGCDSAYMKWKLSKLMGL